MTKKRLIVLGLAAVVTFGATVAPAVQADRYDDQINALNGDSVAKTGTVSQLGSEAASLQDTIAKLQTQIRDLQSQISVNEQKRDETITAIAKAQADLTQQKQYLSDSIKASYIDGGVSSLEMLASSQSINDFVDQQQYQNSVQGQVQRTLETIKQLQTKLTTDKANLENMIATLASMRASVVSQQAEQSRLLALNEQQQADLNNQIVANNAKATDLRKQQALENSRLASGGKIPAGARSGGGYPSVWADAGLDTMLDSWGMYNRECVSYTAFKVAASGRYMPGWGWESRGNAKQWDDNARASGIPVDTNPRPGDVAISNAGSYGHAMYVEAVAADGSIYISDYNQQYDGLYRTYWIAASTVSAKDLQFIHF